MAKKPQYSYKIRQKSTGLYSSGGLAPTFNKNGKTWSGLGPLKNHLNLRKNYTSWTKPLYSPSSDYEIVVLQITELTVGIESLGKLNEL